MIASADVLEMFMLVLFTSKPFLYFSYCIVLLAVHNLIFGAEGTEPRCDTTSEALKLIRKRILTGTRFACAGNFDGSDQVMRFPMNRRLISLGAEVAELDDDDITHVVIANSESLSAGQIAKLLAKDVLVVFGSYVTDCETCLSRIDEDLYAPYAEKLALSPTHNFQDVKSATTLITHAIEYLQVRGVTYCIVALFCSADTGGLACGWMKKHTERERRPCFLYAEHEEYARLACMYAFLTIGGLQVRRWTLRTEQEHFADTFRATSLKGACLGKSLRTLS